MSIADTLGLSKSDEVYVFGLQTLLYLASREDEPEVAFNALHADGGGAVQPRPLTRRGRSPSCCS